MYDYSTEQYKNQQELLKVTSFTEREREIERGRERGRERERERKRER